jgi:hypothetical protein
MAQTKLFCRFARTKSKVLLGGDSKPGTAVPLTVDAQILPWPLGLALWRPETSEK